MIRRNLIIALRSFWRQKLFTTISLAGLTIGLAAFLLILVYIRFELSYDKHFSDHDRIYRLYTSRDHDGKTEFYAKLPGPVSSFLKDNYPQIEISTRVVPGGKLLATANGKNFFEEKLLFADKTFFEIFDYHIIKGSIKNALDGAHSILLTEYMAKKYFGDLDPIGKSLLIDKDTELIVSGIIRNIPHNTHLHFDGLISIDAVNSIFYKDYLINKNNTLTYTYLKFQKGVNPDAFGSYLIDAKNNYYERPRDTENWFLQAVDDIHLYSDLGGEYDVNSSINLIFVLASIAMLTLLIACINYVNLSMAFYSKRTKEIGLKKIIGSNRRQTTGMFYLESMLLASLALILALITVELLLPWFNHLIGRPLHISFKDKYLIGYFLLLLTGIGILVGTIPAIFYAKTNPLSLFKNQLSPKLGGKIVFRNLLLSIQFVITAGLIVCSIVFIQQMSYVKNIDLGFQKKALLVIPLNEKSLQSKTNEIRTKLLNYHSILQATAISDLPGFMKWITSIDYEGFPPNTQTPTMTYLKVDADFINTFGINIKEGENFRIDQYTVKEGYILNEAAMRFMSWEIAVGKWFSTHTDGKMNVVGVMHDFHFKSLHHEIEPLFLAFHKGNNKYNYIVAKISTTDIKNAIKHIGNTIKTFSNNAPFEYFFYDEYIDKLYKADRRFSKIISIFSSLAIFIACFGLFGMSAYGAQQQTKEIGIRKVLGASTSRILSNLSGDYIKWIFISLLFAYPMAYFVSHQWLRNFAYKIDIQWWVFVLATVCVLLVSLLTIIIQSIKAARRNPVEALRYE